MNNILAKHIPILIILNSDFDVCSFSLRGLKFNPYPWRHLDSRLKWTNSYSKTWRYINKNVF